jgi:AraC family transcriptional regulator
MSISTIEVTFPTMNNINIFNELSEQITVRIRSCNDELHNRDWIENKLHSDYDIWYITAGYVHIKTNEGEVRAETGDAVFFYPNIPYNAWTGEVGCKFIYIHFDFGVGNHYKILDGFPLSGVIPSEFIHREAQIFCHAYESFKAQSNLSGIQLKGSFFILLAKIIESYGQGCFKGTFQRSKPYRSQAADFVTLQPVFEYIHANLHRAIRIKEIADVVTMSEKYFIFFFKKAIGLTPGQYIFHLKMNKASVLLYERKYSVKQIASFLGYSDAYSFSKAFKKFYNIPPSRFGE